MFRPFIGLAGKKKSGKTIISKHLREKYKYIELALGDAVKDVAAEFIKLFYGIDNIRYKMDIQNEKDFGGFDIYENKYQVKIKKKYLQNKKDNSIKVDNVSVVELNTPKSLQCNVKYSEPTRVLLYRQILQGTADIMRTKIGHMIWCNVIDMKITNLYNQFGRNINIVINDIRLEDEYKYFKEKYGLYCIKIIRNKFTSILDSHQTEKVDFNTDTELINNGDSVEELWNKIDEKVDINKIKNNISGILL